ncbi:ArsR/SmtB family transcription factor [Sulfitobacter porphyrae]|uniref:ArsR/SmtB family transcription factor n=1 Tax=Sulfitobacter porphyrae TaxID=1246864 RepID=A0ABW2B8J2_9RHOB
MSPDLAFVALADPTRRAIIARLAKGEASVGEIARPFAMSQPVSHHIKVLEESGLITRRIDGTRRPCRLADGALEEIEGWLSMLRRGLEANFDRLDGVLAEMAMEETSGKKE